MPDILHEVVLWSRKSLKSGKPCKKLYVVLRTALPIIQTEYLNCGWYVLRF